MEDMHYLRDPGRFGQTRRFRRMEKQEAPPCVGPAGSSPVDPTLYGPILQEMQTARFDGLGFERRRFVTERLDQNRVLRPLHREAQAVVVLHRQALELGQIGTQDEQRPQSVSRRQAKDFPGQVYHARESKAFHIVNIVGEERFRETLYLLAAAGIPANKVWVMGTPDFDGLIANDLDRTLIDTELESVTVGPLGEITRAIERVLRGRLREGHLDAILQQMLALLEHQVEGADPAHKDRAEIRLARLRQIAGASAPLAARLEAAWAEPSLRAPLGELYRAGLEGATQLELPWSFKARAGRLLVHRVLEIDGRNHLILDSQTVHGDLATIALKHIFLKGMGFRRVCYYGHAGSVTPELPAGSFALPRPPFRSMDPSSRPFHVGNAAAMKGARDARPATISSVLQEHQDGLVRLGLLPAEVMDQQLYHVVRAVDETRRPLELRAVLRILDSATIGEDGARREEPSEKDEEALRREREELRAGQEQAMIALGLVDATAP